MLAVSVALPLASTQYAQAASKEKTFYVPATYKDNASEPPYLAKYTYDENGLLIKIEDSNCTRIFTRNSKGYLTSLTKYSIRHEEAPPTKYVFRYKYNKKGLVATEKNYEQLKKKKVLRHTRTFTYYANGNVKKMVLKRGDGKYYEIHKYRKNGTRKSSYYKSNYSFDSGYERVTYDKHGNMLKLKSPSGTTRHDLRYDKHGNLKKDMYKSPDGQKSTESYKYTYDKHGNILKCVCTFTDKGPYGSDTERWVEKYTYEQVTSSKPYWRFFSKNCLFGCEEYY